MDGYKSMKDHMGSSYKAGGKMGYSHGGKAKAMDSMDNANLPRRKTDAADQRTKEFGNQGPVKPGYKGGGYMKGGHKEDDSMDYKEGGKTKKKKKSESMLKKAKKALSKSAHERRMAKYGLKEGGPVEMAEGGHWIKDAIKKPGALRGALGVKKGKDIPAGKLEAAAKKPGKMGQRARLAETLKGMNKRGGGGVKVHNSKSMHGKY